MSDLTVAIIQSSLHWEDVDANLAMFEEKIWNIGEAVDVIILPEMFNTGFSMAASQLAEVKGLKTHKWLLQMASQKQALVGGSYMVKDGTNYYNRFFAAFPDGTYETYDKRHLFTLAKEEQYYTGGTERIIIDYKGWKICPMVCYDLRFPVWSKNKFNAGTGTFEYDLLTYVASWPKPRIGAWDTLLKARAIENQAYALGCNRVGKDGNDYEYVGHSAFYDYLGDTMDFLDMDEGILIRTLDRDALDQFRKRYAFLPDSDDFSINS